MGRRNGKFGGGSGSSRGSGGGKIPPRNFRNNFDGDDDHEGNDGDLNVINIASSFWILARPDEDWEISEGGNKKIASRINGMQSNDLVSSIRGGGGSTKKQKEHKGLNKSDALGSIGSKLSNFSLFQKRKEDQSQRNQIEKQQQEKELLSSTIIQSVSAPRSTLLPPEIITKSAAESDLIGGTLTPETLEVTASRINRWYWDHGYVMNSVTGATLVPGNSGGEDNQGEGRVELKVREVKLANSQPEMKLPVTIRFVDPFISNGEKEDESIISLSTKQGQHQQYKITSGRTRPSKIARMVKLAPGSHLQILPQYWSRLVANPGGAFGGGGGKSAIFSTIHAVRPIPCAGDNTATLEIIASENKPYASIEYGVTKSLYSDQWEGELDLKHGNAFGGGEIVTMNVRKGRRNGKTTSRKEREEVNDHDSMWENVNVGLKDGPVSWRMSIKDDCVGGSDAGYDVEMFRDYVGKHINTDAQSPVKLSDDAKTDLESRAYDGEGDSPRRTGATLRFRLPFQLRRHVRSVLLPRDVSASVECIESPTSGLASSSIRGHKQSMTSVSINMGPYHFGERYRENNDGAKSTWQRSLHPLLSTISATTTAGAKWDNHDNISTDNDGARVLPYATGAITSQQTMPLLSLNSGSRGTGIPPSVDLAMRHVISASTKHLPRHEAVILGLASRVRGYRYNYQVEQEFSKPSTHKQENQTPMQSLKQFFRGGNAGWFRPPVAIANSISGTVEIRVPIGEVANREFLPSVFSGTFVLFGDWAVSHAQKEVSSSAEVPPLLEEEKSNVFDKPFRHSSIGVGFRKVVQGLPLKMDVCITEHGTRGMFVGIGA